MKHIPLHKVDLPEIIKDNYEWTLSHFENKILSAKTTFRYLFYVFRNSVELLQRNVLLQNAEHNHKRTFHYGLNCISEFCRLAHFPNQEKEAQIDESGRFVVKVEETNLFQGFFTAVAMARIARNEEKENFITNLPIELLDLDRNITFSHTYIHTLMKLEMEYSNLNKFNVDYFENLLEIYQRYKTDIVAKVGVRSN